MRTSFASRSEPAGALKRSHIRRDFLKSQTQYAARIVQSHILHMPLAKLLQYLCISLSGNCQDQRGLKAWQLHLVWKKMFMYWKFSERGKKKMYFVISICAQGLFAYIKYLPWNPNHLHSNSYIFKSLFRFLLQSVLCFFYLHVLFSLSVAYAACVLSPVLCTLEIVGRRKWTKLHFTASWLSVSFVVKLCFCLSLCFHFLHQKTHPT